ncbi:MAG: GNAT family N-acetyltransferase [Candidatus Cloacimonetes bacterium]|nr:GNAT family N-acetyltransferase [Candidatus Cloacimonadota bacterium]
MITTKVFTAEKLPGKEQKNEIVDFLYEHLEKYGDKKEDIEKAVNYALRSYTSFGGFIITSSEADKMNGVVVVNQTGMKGYIPENILVYIATHKEQRGKGIGKLLMKKAIELSEGNVALHVEPDNPARFLYEKMGFTNKYLEMRLNK